MNHSSLFFLFSFLFSLMLSVLMYAGYFGYSADHHNYVSLYGLIGESFYEDKLRYEIGFVWLLKVFKSYFGADFLTLASILAFFTLFIKLIYLSSAKSYTLLIVFTLCFYFIHEFTQIRMSISIAFIVLSLFAYENKRYYICGLLLVVACLFQYSSLLFLGLFVFYHNFVYRKEGSRFRIVIMSLVCSVVIYMGLEFLVYLNPLIEVYLQDEYSMNLFSVRLVFLYLLYLVFYVYYEDFDENQRLLFTLFSGFIFVTVALNRVPVISIRLLEVMYLLPLYLCFVLKRRVAYVLRFVSLFVCIYVFYKEFILLGRVNFESLI